jgi:class 3 adenylate cyclase
LFLEEQMPDSLQTRLEQLHHSMAVLEAQRAVLGDAVVDPALAGLRQQIAALQVPESPRPAAPDERSLITVLFADVVGSTAMEEALDPEQVTEIMNRVLTFMNASVAKHDGMVADLRGDAIIAFFGTPDTREDDAERAVRAALDIQAAAQTYAQYLQQQHHLEFNVRVGIHSGLALLTIVGDQIKTAYTAMGDTTNLASRLQSAAPPGGILISHETYRLVRGLFQVTRQPPLHVKGKTAPIQTYLVRRANPRPFRAMNRGVAGIPTRTIGREAEIERLQRAYSAAVDQRQGVWAQIIGEPGVGKSRLLDEMYSWMERREETYNLFRARAYAGDSGQPFPLIRRMWFDRFQIAEDAPLAQAEAKWVKGFQELSQTDDIEPAHALGLLVGLPFNDSPYIGAMRNDPAQVKGRAFVATRELFKTLRVYQPIVVLLEDLHWADASSWDYLRESVLQDLFPEAQNGMFIIATARPEWSIPDTLRQHSNYVQLDLAPLPEEAARELAHELLREVDGVPPPVIEMLTERSEGVPYYAEELVNWFIDRRIIDQSSERWRFIPERLQENPFPTTLQHLLLTRLSLLSENERTGLQRGAIFGRNFWEGGLTALGALQPDVLLNALRPRGFVDMQSESSLGGEKEWSFHHALLRDATYESILKRERAGLHKAAADWLEEQARRAGRLDEFAGLLGEHAERADDKFAAADWYLRAGERARSQGATREAERFCSRALGLMPSTDHGRRWRALLTREEVLAILGAQEAYQADVISLVTLAREMGDDRLLAEALMRQCIYLNRKADYRGELPVVEETLSIAGRAGDQFLQVRALSEKVFVLTRLGELEKAGAGAEEALARARELGDGATLAQVLISAALRVGYSGDWARLIAMYDEAASLWHQLGDRYREALVLSNLGYAYTQLGLYRHARGSLEQARRLTEAIAARRQRAYSLQNLGLVYWRSGDGRQAREVLAESARELEVVGDALAQATSLLYMAYELEQSGNLSLALRRYLEAREIFGGLGALGYAHDASAGMARCALKEGRLDQARELAVELGHYLKEHGSAGMDTPIWAYETCADICGALASPSTPLSAGAFSTQTSSQVASSENDLRGLGRETIRAGYSELMERAGRISNVEWRHSFLENVPEHRSMIELWEIMNDKGD